MNEDKIEWVNLTVPKRLREFLRGFKEDDRIADWQVILELLKKVNAEGVGDLEEDIRDKLHYVRVGPI